MKKTVISDTQMEALEAFIAMAENQTPLGRKTLIWAIRQTKNFTRPVRINIKMRKLSWTNQRFDDKDYWNWAEQAVNCAHSICSAMGTNHLNFFLIGMGCNFIISFRAGSDETSIWISPEALDKCTEVLIPDYDEILAVIVKNPCGALNGKGLPIIDIK